MYGNFAVEPLVRFQGVKFAGMLFGGASDEMRVAPPSVVLEHPASPDGRGIQPQVMDVAKQPNSLSCSSSLAPLERASLGNH